MNASIDATTQRTDWTYAVHGQERGRPFGTLSIEQGADWMMIHCDRSTLTRGIDALVKLRAALDEAERACMADTPVLAQ